LDGLGVAADAGEDAAARRFLAARDCHLNHNVRECRQWPVNVAASMEQSFAAFLRRGWNVQSGGRHG
jgi:hypothetical protein